MRKYIKGIFKREIYKSDKGYIIGVFKISETTDEELIDFIDKTITFTGYFHELSLDENYTFYGNIVIHPKYGFQYEVIEYEKVLPQDEDGIILFLSSELFKGIGKSQAQKIVETLGSDALKKIIDDKSCLYLVPKLTDKKIDIIYNTLSNYIESHEVIVYLTSIGFTMQDALTIYNQHKKKTTEIIEQNIYKLIDINGITFNKIDLIAHNMGMDIKDPRRIKSCIIFIMNNLVFSTGNTYLEYEEIYDALTNYLRFEISFEDYDEYLSKLINEKKIFKDEYKYYLYDMYMAERNIINKIKILKQIEKTNYKNIEKKIKELEELNNIIYNNSQKEAIKKALENNLLIITGGPGTGKTTIIKAITSLYKLLNNISDKNIIDKIALLAPTGRASKRMSEATNLPAYTIHRYLKWNKENNSFGINEYNKNNHELIIIDEVSMIDINLLDSLFKGINDNIKLVLVGDYNQLPSVGPGQILKDFVLSNVIDKVELDFLYRQNENSYINILANDIKNNSIDDKFLNQHDDYLFLKGETNLKNNLISLAKKLKEKKYNYKEIQFMAPLYKGECGIDNLNTILQDIFNPQTNQKEITYGDVIYRENDKILQLVNFPDENVYNGDIGKIEKILFANESESKKNELYINYDGNIIKYEPNDFNKIKHGFIISIHKSQGSEFDNVIIPISNSYKRMLYKKIIYTAVTRAKKKLIIVGDENAFLYSVNNNNEQIRKTDLLNKLYKLKNIS